MSRHDHLELVYRGYEDAAAGRWAPANPGNRAIHAERNAGFAAAIASAGRPSTVVELGCGDGRLLRELADLAPLQGASLVGLDLLGFRLLEARAAGLGLPLLHADGCALPLASASIDLLVVSTVFSSILDHGTASAVAGEVDRVLRPEALVLWYDMRLPNPWNRDVQAMSRRRIRALFPGYEVQLASTTVLPQLARRLGSRTPSLYPAVARIPALRSHLLGTLQKPR